MKDPAFLFYTKDFQSGTQHMSCEEVGAYIRLLMFQHQHGEIPNDTERLMRITGIFTKDEFESVWSVVSTKFNQTVNHLVNERLNEEISKRKENRPKRMASATLAGLISANKLTPKQKELVKKEFNVSDYVDYTNDEIKIKVKEWFYNLVNHLVNNNANANANINSNNNINNECENEIYSFDDFWNDYDKKVGKPKSEDLWRKLKDSEKEEIQKYIPEYKKSQPDKQFRKNPATFLYQKGWTDELIFENKTTKQATNVSKAPKYKPY